MTAAIFYHPDGYDTNVAHLMGRNVAGESFLKGFFLYSKENVFDVFVNDVKHIQQFSNTLNRYRKNGVVNSITPNNYDKLSKSGALFFPGPDIVMQACQREFFGANQWSLIGITHTTCTAKVMDSIAGLLTAPIQPWDAVICTSNSVKKNIQCILDEQMYFLNRRLGVSKKINLPEFPVIPLGVHCQDFQSTEELKRKSRDFFVIPQSSIVVLYVGRLSFHSKSHPMAMYQALQNASLITKKDVVLIECGWYANDEIKKAFFEAAQLTCPNVKVIHVDGRDNKSRIMSWSAADIFCSLSDNIQESFGITPIEAMSAGLPVVVSDWDGYKDTVRNGVDGFRVRTIMPPAGAGAELIQAYALGCSSYDRYCADTSSLIAVDIQETTEAFIRLFESSELRMTMGQAGKNRAQTIYDWSNIIAAYENLFDELSKIRRSQADGNVYAWPGRLDPFYSYANYATHSLNKESVLTCSVDEPFSVFLRYKNLKMVNYMAAKMTSDQDVLDFLIKLANKRCTLQDSLEYVEESKKQCMIRTICWLIKLGIIKVV